MRLLLCTSALFLAAQVPDAPLRFEATPQGPRVIARLPVDFAGKLPAGKLSQEQGEAVLTLSLLADDTKKPGPSMFGKYERTGNDLAFIPRFPLSPGATYRATLTVDGKLTSLDHVMPKLAAKAPPKVIKIYPTADVLPANHLRFYIYFDRPMRGGKDLFKHLVILDDKGKEVEEPWLVDEIWDEENNCLILYIHPGRIKWGVELRELMGPVLYEKRNYSLIVRGEWTDLEGNKIGKDTIKKFSTAPEDRVRVELKDWKLTEPKASTRDAVTLTLPKSIDYRSLQTGLTVTNPKDELVAGTIAIGKDEKSWQFTPKQPWQTGIYSVNVSPELEDTCGNTPLRPFDMDLKAPRPRAQKLFLEFEPR
jgi:hypothetical protein